MSIQELEATAKRLRDSRAALRDQRLQIESAAREADSGTPGRLEFRKDASASAASSAAGRTEDPVRNSPFGRGFRASMRTGEKSAQSSVQNGASGSERAQSSRKAPPSASVAASSQDSDDINGSRVRAANVAVEDMTAQIQRGVGFFGKTFSLIADNAKATYALMCQCRDEIIETLSQQREDLEKAARALSDYEASGASLSSKELELQGEFKRCLQQLGTTLRLANSNLVGVFCEGGIDRLASAYVHLMKVDDNIAKTLTGMSQEAREKAHQKAAWPPAEFAKKAAFANVNYERDWEKFKKNHEHPHSSFIGASPVVCKRLRQGTTDLMGKLQDSLQMRSVVQLWHTETQHEKTRRKLREAEVQAGEAAADAPGPEDVSRLRKELAFKLADAKSRHKANVLKKQMLLVWQANLARRKRRRVQVLGLDKMTTRSAQRSNVRANRCTLLEAFVMWQASSLRSEVLSAQNAAAASEERAARAEAALVDDEAAAAARAAADAHSASRVRMKRAIINSVMAQCEDGSFHTALRILQVWATYARLERKKVQKSLPASARRGRSTASVDGDGDVEDVEPPPTAAPTNGAARSLLPVPTASDPRTASLTTRPASSRSRDIAISCVVRTRRRLTEHGLQTLVLKAWWLLWIMQADRDVEMERFGDVAREHRIGMAAQLFDAFVQRRLQVLRRCCLRAWWQRVGALQASWRKGQLKASAIEGELLAESFFLWSATACGVEAENDPSLPAADFAEAASDDEELLAASVEPPAADAARRSPRAGESSGDELRTIGRLEQRFLDTRRRWFRELEAAARRAPLWTLAHRSFSAWTWQAARVRIASLRDRHMYESRAILRQLDIREDAVLAHDTQASYIHDASRRRTTASLAAECLALRGKRLDAMRSAGVLGDSNLAGEGGSSPRRPARLRRRELPEEKPQEPWLQMSRRQFGSVRESLVRFQRLRSAAGGQMLPPRRGSSRADSTLAALDAEVEHLIRIDTLSRLTYEWAQLARSSRGGGARRRDLQGQVVQEAKKMFREPSWPTPTAIVTSFQEHNALLLRRNIFLATRPLPGWERGLRNSEKGELHRSRALRGITQLYFGMWQTHTASTAVTRLAEAVASRHTEEMQELARQYDEGLQGLHDGFAAARDRALAEDGPAAARRHALLFLLVQAVVSDTTETGDVVRREVELFNRSFALSQCLAVWRHLAAVGDVARRRAQLGGECFEALGATERQLCEDMERLEHMPPSIQSTLERLGALLRWHLAADAREGPRRGQASEVMQSRAAALFDEQARQERAYRCFLAWLAFVPISSGHRSRRGHRETLEAGAAKKRAAVEASLHSEEERDRLLPPDVAINACLAAIARRAPGAPWRVLADARVESCERSLGRTLLRSVLAAWKVAAGRSLYETSGRRLKALAAIDAHAGDDFRRIRLRALCRRCLGAWRVRCVKTTAARGLDDLELLCQADLGVARATYVHKVASSLDAVGQTRVWLRSCLLTWFLQATRGRAGRGIRGESDWCRREALRLQRLRAQKDAAARLRSQAVANLRQRLRWRPANAERLRLLEATRRALTTRDYQLQVQLQAAAQMKQLHEAEKARSAHAVVQLGHENASLRARASAATEAAHELREREHAGATSRVVEVVDDDAEVVDNAEARPLTPRSLQTAARRAPTPSRASPGRNGVAEVPALEGADKISALTKLVKDLQHENSMLHSRSVSQRDKEEWMAEMVHLVEELRNENESLHSQTLRHHRHEHSSKRHGAEIVRGPHDAAHRRHSRPVSGASPRHHSRRHRRLPPPTGLL
eukprot:TRINITY_DN20522_c0_g1_i1.p1 TRINITY_DN20522_c0_g1~~TRINITY_DN20522_c0_g1_i1.p1  ORF type:complete len:1793 (-),score=414.08 TRINITY_DN20522_c0_g1_i1:115-5493(-)